jgi:hypothetical protein
LPLQPAGQQPSPLRQAVTRAWLHAREQPAIVPDAQSDVQASPSSQVAGQAPAIPVVMARSQASSGLSTPSPHTAAQSVSRAIVHPGGQHPSPPMHAVTGCETQMALQVPMAPSSRIGLQASLPGHVVGQAVGPAP